LQPRIGPIQYTVLRHGAGVSTLSHCHHLNVIFVTARFYGLQFDEHPQPRHRWHRHPRLNLCSGAAGIDTCYIAADCRHRSRGSPSGHARHPEAGVRCKFGDRTVLSTKSMTAYPGFQSEIHQLPDRVRQRLKHLMTRRLSTSSIPPTKPASPMPPTPLSQSTLPIDFV